MLAIYVAKLHLSVSWVIIIINWKTEDLKYFYAQLLKCALSVEDNFVITIDDKKKQQHILHY